VRGRAKRVREKRRGRRKEGYRGEKKTGEREWGAEKGEEGSNSLLPELCISVLTNSAVTVFNLVFTLHTL